MLRFVNMIKQILGRLSRKPSKSTPNATNSNDGGVTVASSMNLSHGVNSGGVGVNNLKGSLGRANSTSNVPGVNKLNQGNKPLIVASQAGPMLASSAYVALPSFREVSTSEKPNLFI
ncbi:hypothetical protein GIB67_040999 [Kingdonia uniflora]|uniref:Uncharacterized protein n=1 Tax=Kingdonia uniflora TaxID=39325 RepID=A0A7J7NC71_9MAGN|nr:hypothetical protein GIB67_040999 [Kingdonia uniflora]